MLQFHPAISSSIAEQHRHDLLSQAEAARRVRAARTARTESPDARVGPRRPGIHGYRAGLARLVPARAR